LFVFLLFRSEQCFCYSEKKFVSLKQMSSAHVPNSSDPVELLHWITAFNSSL
jgi:hypothetical protein